MITQIEWREEIQEVPGHPELGQTVKVLWAYDDINHFGWFRVPTVKDNI